MTAHRFTAWLDALTTPSRRSALGALGGLGLAGLVGHSTAQAKRKKRTCARAGQTTSKKRKKCCAGLVKDALRSGVCQPCDVTCLSGDPETCGNALQAALSAVSPDGATLYVCPGRYHGSLGFTSNRTTAVRIIGAGAGTDPARNTILDGLAAQLVLFIHSLVETTELERLSITGGNGTFGGGIVHQGTMLRMTDCTISHNTSWDSPGAGIQVSGTSTLELTRCHVHDNHAAHDITNEDRNLADGGAVAMYGSGTATLTDCLVEANRADALGGGLANFGTMTLAGTTRVRRNHADAVVLSAGGGIANDAAGTLIIAETCRVTENIAGGPGQGGGIRNFGGTVTLPGATPSPIVVNNCHENCVEVDTCAARPISC